MTSSTAAAPVAPARPEPPAPPTAPPRWYRPGFAAVLALAAVLDAWGVGAHGDTNTFYAAAVQASTRNPVAWLFAAVDAPGLITVDKPPLDNWWMGLWANLFGFSTWSMLLPQAALGVGMAALLMLTVRRWSGPGAALGAGALLALTPVVVVMARWDDPDPMLTFLLVAAGYALVRALDAAPRRAGTGWMIACGALVGLGFLAKMGVALLVVPAFALVFLVAAGVPWRRRIGQLLAGGAGLVVGAGWFVALVALWPASERPYIGGSTDNSLLQLAVGYNGVSRLAGRQGGPSFGGNSAGIGRMFSPDYAGQIAWLLPAALLVIVVLAWTTRRAPAGDRLRAAALLWGGWLVVSGLVFSLMAGTGHTYYTIVMAPAIAALVAIGVREGWRHRAETGARVLLAVGVAGTAVWSVIVLDDDTAFVPWLRWLVLAAGVLAAVLLLLPPGLGRRVGVVGAVVLGLVGALGGTSAYALDTTFVPHAGTEASAGPAAVGGFGRGGAFAGGRGRTPGAGAFGGRSRGGPGGAPAGNAARAAFAAFGGRGTADPAVVALLHGTSTQWSAATPSTMSAAGLELASDTSVMGLGGFSGSDPYPTLAEFQQDVAAHLVRYYVAPAAGGGGGPFGGRQRDSAIAPIQQWVAAHFTPTRVGADTVYDLAAPAH